MLIFHFSIIKRLILTSVIIIVTVIAMGGMNIFLMQRIGGSSLSLIKMGTERVIHNSKLTRTINAVLSDVYFLINVFLEEDRTVLQDEKERLGLVMKEIVNTPVYKNDPFYGDLFVFKGVMDSLLHQAARTQRSVHKVKECGMDVEKCVSLLEYTVTEVYIKHKFEGNDFRLNAIGQIMNAIPDFKNMLFQLERFLADARRQSIARAMKDTMHIGITLPKILSLVKKLELEFESAKHAGPEIALLSSMLVAKAGKYRRAIVSSDSQMQSFTKKVKELRAMEEKMARIISIADIDVEKTTKIMETDIANNVRSSVELTLLLSVIIFIILGLFGVVIFSIIRSIKYLSKRIDSVREHFGFQRYERKYNGNELKNFTDSFNEMATVLAEKTVSIEDLKKEQRKFQDIAASSGDWIWEVDVEGRYTYASPTVEKLLGYGVEEIVGYFFYDFYHPDDRDRLMKTVFAAFTENEVIQNLITHAVHKNGREVTIESTSVPIFDHDKKCIGYRGVDRDITERKIAEEKLKTAYSNLKETHAKLIHAEKIAVIGQLAAGMAHEINNPAAFIKCNLEALDNYGKKFAEFYSGIGALLAGHFAENPETAAGVRERFEVIKQTADLDYIIKDLPGLIQESLAGTIAISKIASSLKSFANPDPDALVPVDIASEIETAMVIIGNELKEKCEIVKVYQPDLPSIKSKRGRLSQVFVNLLLNAVQAMEKKGIISIKAYRDDSSVAVEISDTGKGIPRELVGKIFDPFFTTKDIGQGAGLGLFVVYGIIKDHKGTIEVKSEVGKGTSFLINLPSA